MSLVFNNHLKFLFKFFFTRYKSLGDFFIIRGFRFSNISTALDVGGSTDPIATWVLCSSNGAHIAGSATSCVRDPRIHRRPHHLHSPLFVCRLPLPLLRSGLLSFAFVPRESVSAALLLPSYRCTTSFYWIATAADTERGQRPIPSAGESFLAWMR